MSWNSIVAMWTVYLWPNIFHMSFGQRYLHFCSMKTGQLLLLELWLVAGLCLYLTESWWWSSNRYYLEFSASHSYCWSLHILVWNWIYLCSYTCVGFVHNLCWINNDCEELFLCLVYKTTGLTKSQYTYKVSRYWFIKALYLVIDRLHTLALAL